MKTLKIAAIKVNGTIYKYEGDIYELMDDLTEKCYSDTDYITSDWWYLHGELEKEVGYDTGIFLNLESFETIIEKCYFNGNKEYFNVVYLKDGIYDVEVLNIDKPCIGYFWIADDNVPKLRGLVAFKDDKEAIDYITKKYNEKSKIL